MRAVKNDLFETKLDHYGRVSLPYKLILLFVTGYAGSFSQIYRDGRSDGETSHEQEEGYVAEDLET